MTKSQRETPQGQEARAARSFAPRRPWKRLLIASCVTLFVGVVAFFALFLTSGCWKKHRPFLQALDDFVFIPATLFRKEFGTQPPPFTDELYDEVIVHLDSRADLGARSAARWYLENWGADAAPRLLVDLNGSTDYARQRAAVEILAQHRVREAVPGLVRLLLDRGRFRLADVTILEAIDSYQDPALLPHLIEFAERALDRAGHPLNRNYRRALLSIARTGAGHEYLVKLVERHGEACQAVFESLIETRDPRAVRVVVRYLDHANFVVRRDACVALSNCAAAAPTLLKKLTDEKDDFQRRLLVEVALHGRVMAAVPGVAAALGRHKGDPVIGSAVRTTLTQHDSPWAMAALWDCLDWEAPPDEFDLTEFVSGLREAPRYGPTLLRPFLRHADPRVRRHAVYALAEIRQPVSAESLAAVAAGDPDESLRRRAADELLKQDKFRLHASYSRHRGKPEPSSDALRLRRGIIELLIVPHFALTVFAFLFAVALVLGRVKPLEPDRFRFYVSFYLIAGFLGDFVLCDRRESMFLTFVGVHTLLLTGYLVQERAFVHRRFEHLAGASLWVLVPTALYWGAPVLAVALRAAAGEYSFFFALNALLALNLLSAVPIFLRWLHIPAWVRRGLVSGVLGSFLVLLCLALAYSVTIAWARGDSTHAVVAALLIVPLALKLAGLIADSRESEKGKTPELPAASPGRMLLLDHGPTTTLRLSRRVAWPALILCVLGLSILTGFAGGLYSSYFGGGEHVVIMCVGMIGAWMLRGGWRKFRCLRVIQIRDGRLRHGVVSLGAVVASANWRRLPPQNLDLTEDEQSFIRAIVKSSSPTSTTSTVSVGEEVPA